MMQAVTGSWRLFRLALRRDRVKLTISLLAIGVLVPMLVTGVSEVFASDDEMKQGLALLAANPIMRLFGLPTGDALGNLIMLRAFMMLAIIAALVNSFAIVRHTRQNEELGRSELLGSNVVGRHAGLVSALGLAVVINICISALVAGGAIIGGLPAVGSVAMGLAVGTTGLMFAGVAAVTAQLSQTSRGANGYAAVAIMASFMLSGVGSVLGQVQGAAADPAWPIWLSPMGWSQLLKPFAGEQWWLLFVIAAFFISCVALALALSSRRDVGRGLLAMRPGRAVAPPGLLGAVGLAWRLQRGMFFGWLIGMTLLGVIYGLVAGDVEELFSQAEGIAEIFVATTGSDQLLLAFFGSVVGLMALFVLAYGVSAAIRLRAEEDRALEYLLSTGLSRLRWAGAQFGVALAATFVMLIVSVAAVGIAAEATLDQSLSVLWPVIVGAALQFPALAVIIGSVLLLFGFVPRYTVGIAWGVVALSIILSPFFSSLLSLPEQFGNLSPLSHVPVVPPVDAITYTPVLILSAVAVLFIGLGLWRFSNRDILTK